MKMQLKDLNPGDLFYTTECARLNYYVLNEPFEEGDCRLEARELLPYIRHTQVHLLPSSMEVFTDWESAKAEIVLMVQYEIQKRNYELDVLKRLEKPNLEGLI